MVTPRWSDGRCADRARIRARQGNAVFDGAGQDGDFAFEQITGDAVDRYGFRSSPLRNGALQAAFFHNGATTRIENTIYHHLDVFRFGA